MEHETSTAWDLEFKAMIEVPVTVRANIRPASGDGWNEPYIPEHPEDIVIRFDSRQVQAELDRVAEERWLSEYVMEKWEESRGEALVSARTDHDHPLGGLRPVTVRPKIPA